MCFSTLEWLVRTGICTRRTDELVVDPHMLVESREGCGKSDGLAITIAIILLPATRYTAFSERAAKRGYVEMTTPECIYKINDLTLPGVGEL